MSNLTINVDDQLIKQARVRAIQQGTSLSAKVREFLSAYAAGVSQQGPGDATTELLRMIDSVRTEARRRRAQHPTAGANSTKSGSGSDRANNTNSANRAKLRTGAHRTLRSELYDGDFRASDRIRNPKKSSGTGGT